MAEDRVEDSEPPPPPTISMDKTENARTAYAQIPVFTPATKSIPPPPLPQQHHQEGSFEKRIFVGGLARTTTEQSLGAFLERKYVAKVLEVDLRRDSLGNSRGFAFVVFDKPILIPLGGEFLKLETRRIQVLKAQTVAERRMVGGNVRQQQRQGNMLHQGVAMVHANPDGSWAPTTNKDSHVMKFGGENMGTTSSNIPTISPIHIGSPTSPQFFHVMDPNLYYGQAGDALSPTATYMDRETAMAYAQYFPNEQFYFYTEPQYAWPQQFVSPSVYTAVGGNEGGGGGGQRF